MFAVQGPPKLKGNMALTDDYHSKCCCSKLDSSNEKPSQRSTSWPASGRKLNPQRAQSLPSICCLCVWRLVPARGWTGSAPGRPFPRQWRSPRIAFIVYNFDTHNPMHLHSSGRVRRLRDGFICSPAALSLQGTSYFWNVLFHNSPATYCCHVGSAFLSPPIKRSAEVTGFLLSVSGSATAPDWDGGRGGGWL